KAGVKIHDRASDRTYLLKVGRHDLRSGDYEIDVSELPAGLEFSVTKFTLKRGGTVRVSARVRRRLPAPGPAEELARLRGRWKPVSAEFSGNPMPPAMFKMIRVAEVEGDKIYLRPSEDVKVELTLRLDPARTPRQVDAVIRIAGKPIADVVGIYALEGDT